MSVSATEPNSTLRKLRSKVGILELGVPIKQVTNASDRIYQLIKSIRKHISFCKCVKCLILTVGNQQSKKVYAGCNVLAHVAEMFLNFFVLTV